VEIDPKYTNVYSSVYLTWWPWTCVTCCAAHCDNCQVSTRSTYPFLTYNVLLLIRYVTLWPWPIPIHYTNVIIIIYLFIYLMFKVLVWEAANLFPYQISMKYLNPWLR